MPCGHVSSFSMPIRLSANLSQLCPDLPFRERFAAAAAAAFDAVECQLPYELPAIELARLLTEHGLVLPPGRRA